MKRFFFKLKEKTESSTRLTSQHTKLLKSFTYDVIVKLLIFKNEINLKNKLEDVEMIVLSFSKRTPTAVTKTSVAVQKAMNSEINKQNREKINSGSQSACNYPRVYVQFPRLV